MGRLKRLERKRDQTLANIESLLGHSPVYEISKEALDINKYYQQGADELAKYSDEAVRLAKRRAASNMPGYESARALSNIRTSQQLLETKKLGKTANIGNIYASQREADLGLALQNAQYRDALLNNLENVMFKRGMIGGQIADLRARGLDYMTQQRDKAYNYNQLMPYQQNLQYQMQKYANLTSEMMGIRQARAQMASAVIQGISSAVGSLVTLGAAAGG